MNKIAFVSGHLDLTQEEFNWHYIPRINQFIDLGYVFIVGDANGCDKLTQEYLFQQGTNFIVYHMFEKPRNLVSDKISLVGGFVSDEDRDSAMTKNSDVDVAWVRKGREKSGTAKNLKRRKKYV
jgi:hypothetical protein